MSDTKDNKDAAPIRRRKQLIARRWCFFVLLVLTIFFFVIWTNTHCSKFWNVLSWVIFGVWLFTLFQVLYCKFFPPIITPLMVKRFFQQRKTDGANVRFEWKYVPIEEISPNMINVADTAENMGLFFYCRGFLFKALRQAYNLNKTCDTLRGGSVIYQQTAKNCFLPHNRTLFRKIVEAYYVVLMELFWSKKRIMEYYLNIIEFGKGIYGCEAASQHYFRHSAASLNEDEALLLAASLPWPLRANPNNHTPYYDRRILLLKKRLLSYEPIDWDAKYGDVDLQKIEEGNRGLVFFVKWWCLQQIKN